MPVTEPDAVESEKVVVDFTSITLGEICDIEDAIGEAAASTLLSGKPSPKAMIAGIWIVKRRTDPDLTFEGMRALTMNDIDVA